MLSFLKKKYLSGIGIVRSEDELENYSSEEYVEENNNTSSENKNSHTKTNTGNHTHTHGHSQNQSQNNNNHNHSHGHTLDNKSPTKSDGKNIVDYRRSKVIKHDTNSKNSSSHTTSNSSSSTTHTKITTSTTTRSVNNTSKTTKNEASNPPKKPVSPVKLEYKRPSSMSKIDYKRPSSSLSTTSSTVHKTSTTKKSSHVSPSNETYSSIKKPEIPKKPLKRDSISNLNSLKRSNSQSQITSKVTTKKADSLNRVASPTPGVSTKKKDTINSNTSSTVKKQLSSPTSPKKASSVKLKKNNTTSTIPSPITINKKRDESPISSIPKIPSPLQSLNTDSPVNDLYEIVNKYKKLNESPLSVQDKKLKRNSLNIEIKSSNNSDIKKTSTLSRTLKDENKHTLKEEQKISEKLDNLRKTLNSHSTVAKTSTITKTMKEDKNLNSTSEKKISTKSKIDAFNNKIANLNSAIENKNKNSNVSTVKNSIGNKEKESTTSISKSSSDLKERKNVISNLNSVLENRNKRSSISNLKSVTENKEKDRKTTPVETVKKSLESKNNKSSLSNLNSVLASKERKNSVPNLNSILANKEKRSSVPNLNSLLVNRERRGSFDSLKQIIESRNKKDLAENESKKSTVETTNKKDISVAQKSNQPIKIVSKSNKYSSFTPKTSLLFNIDNNTLKDDANSKKDISIKDEKTLTVTENMTEAITETITETMAETDSILSKSSLESIEAIPPPTPIFTNTQPNTFSDQGSDDTLNQNVEENNSPISSNITSPTINTISRQNSFSTPSPAIPNIGTMNMANFTNGGLKKKRSGWWDNIKDKNEEKQLIKESIRSFPQVNVKADESESPITKKFDFTHRKSSSMDGSHINNLPESKFTHLINISDNRSVSSTPVVSSNRLEGNSDEEIYRKSMNEIEVLMNKAKLSDQNESIINALDIVINFCKENGFTKTIDSLKEETKHYTNSENTKNIKKYFENRNFDLAINYIKAMFSKYKPSDIPNYDEIVKSYNDMLYVLYRYQYINLIQKRKMNEAKVKILNVVVKKRVINSYTIGGNYSKYFEDDNFFLSELLIRGPLSSANPYKSFNMNIHLKQFWLKSYAEKEYLNYWPFLEMFFNESKDDSSPTNPNSNNLNSISLNNLIKFTKGVQDVIDNYHNSINGNAMIMNDSMSIKSNKATPTPSVATISSDIAMECPSSRLKHNNLQTRKSETKLTKSTSNDSFKSTNSLRTRLLRESSKSNIKLTGALPLSLGHKTSTSSINSDLYGSSFKSSSSNAINININQNRNTIKRHNSFGLSRKTSQVFDEETASNTKPIKYISKTRRLSSGIGRSHSAAGNYSTGSKRNSIDLEDYRMNPRNSYHGGDNFFAINPMTHYADEDIGSMNSDNNSIYSLSSCDWLNFSFDGFIGPYAGGIRAMDVQYTSKKDGFGNPIDGVFGQLVVAVAIDSIQDHSISIWDVHTKTCLATMLNTNSAGNTKAVEMIKFHPTFPNIFLTSDQDFDVKLWDWTQGSVDANGNYRIEPIRVWKKFHKRIIHKMDFLPNNSSFAISCSSDNTIQIWNINDENKNNVKRIVSNNPISAFTFANNNKYLVAASMYILRIYDMENYKLINTIELEDLKSSKMTINYMETHITNDNLLLLSCASHLILYDLSSTSGLRVFDSPYISPDQKIEGHFSPYGQYVYSGSIIPKYFASLPTTENPPNYPNINNGATGSSNNNNSTTNSNAMNNIHEVGSTCSNSFVNSIDIKDKEGTGFYLWNVDSGRFEHSSIKQMEKDVEPYLSSTEKVSVCQWINVPCINDPDTNAQIFIFGTTDKVLRFYCFCDCHLTD